MTMTCLCRTWRGFRKLLVNLIEKSINLTIYELAQSPKNDNDMSLSHLELVSKSDKRLSSPGACVKIERLLKSRTCVRIERLENG